jgi:23S rRNA pseudouridine2457 synthase
MAAKKRGKQRPRPAAPHLILLNKPYRVLCQFTDREGRPTLADHVDTPDVYAAGRLDYESEGLVVLTNDGRVQQWISEPRYKLSKTYWVQVEGIPDETALTQLRQGVTLNDGPTLPAEAELMEPPAVWPRVPPIRPRKNVPDTWILFTLREGRNRQVRRMTAATGFPTLRLIRWAIGPWTVAGLAPGQSRIVPAPHSPHDLSREE